jgi:hypothetical protein
MQNAAAAHITDALIENMSLALIALSLPVL